MGNKVVVGFLAAVFIIVTLCDITHDGGIAHETAAEASSHCCVIAPAGYDLAHNATATFFMASLLFLLTLVFFTPSKTTRNLYRPPRHQVKVLIGQLRL